MKRFGIFFILLCCLTSNAFGQQKVKSMYDGKKRIYYSTVEEAESKLLEYIQANNQGHDFPSKLFVNLVLNDDRCFYYDFGKLIEASAEVTIRQLRIETSNDGKLRLYSWDADGGTMSCYTGITSYKNQNGIHSYASPIGEDWEFFDEKDPYIQMGIISCGVTKIVTLPCTNGHNVYVVFTHSSASNIMQTSTLDAYIIDSNGLKSVQIFPKEYEYTSSISYYRDPSQAYSTGIMLSNDELIIPETMESEKPYGSARITGRNLVYKFDGEKFKFYKTEYSENLYSGLCNYLYNIIIINASPWIIRIDKMPNGAIRYASWKNKPENEKPDLIIANGYCASSELKENKDSGLWGAKVSKDEKYIFQNNEYFYEVSWKYEGGYEFTHLHSWKLIVKRNDTVLMTLTPEE